MEERVSDEQLWERIQGSDLAAFETLYNRFFSLLYNYGSKFARDAQALEDAIHDMFLDVWKYRANLTATTSVKFYLYSALRRKIFRNDRQPRSVLEDWNDNPGLLTVSAEDEIVLTEQSDETIELLRKSMKKLPPRQYEALMLKYYNDFSYEEIGAMLKVNSQSARNLVQRALQHLRNISKVSISVIPAVLLSI